MIVEIIRLRHLNIRRVPCGTPLVLGWALALAPGDALSRDASALGDALSRDASALGEASTCPSRGRIAVCDLSNALLANIPRT